MTIKTHETLKDFDPMMIRQLSSNQNYFEAEQVYIHFYADSVTIRDIRNSLKPGAICKAWHIHQAIKPAKENFECEFLNHLVDLGTDLYGFIQLITETGELPTATKHQFRFYESDDKAVRTFSPFIDVKPISPPNKWTLTHLVKALMAGQTQSRKDNYFSDDYYDDAARNYRRGETDPIELAREVMEDPGGWRVSVSEETAEIITLSVNCHSFDLNTVIFYKNGKPEALKPKLPDNVILFPTQRVTA